MSVRSKSSMLMELSLLALVIVTAGLLLFFCYGKFYRAAYPIHYQEIVEAASEENGLSASLVFAVIHSESGFDPTAQSSIPARGLMQITKATFEWAQLRVKEQRQLEFDDLYDGELNIHYGAIILGMHLAEFGTEETALCAYHAGRDNAKKWLRDPQYSPDGIHIEHIPFGDTRRYVKKVMETKATYETLYADQ